MNERGAILILALWIVALLSVLSYAVVVRGRLSIREDKWQSSEVECGDLLLALGSFCVQRLQQDEDLEFDAYSEPWGRVYETDSATLMSQFPGIDPSAFDFVLYARPIDESGKININVASASLIQATLMEAGIGAQSADLAKSIIDWRDADNIGQSEADAYAGHEPPYAPPNADFQRIEELLFVKGVDAGLFFGEDYNFNGILDDNEDDGDVNWPPDNRDGRLNLGLIHLFTVLGDGTININTASEIVLRSVLQVALDDPVKSEMITATVLSHRRGKDGIDGSEDDNPFKTEAELIAFAGVLLGEENAVDAMRLAEPFSVKSDDLRFYLRVTMPENHLIKQAELLVSRKDGDFRLLEFH